MVADLRWPSNDVVGPNARYSLKDGLSRILSVNLARLFSRMVGTGRKSVDNR